MFHCSAATAVTSQHHQLERLLVSVFSPDNNLIIQVMVWSDNYSLCKYVPIIYYDFFRITADSLYNTTHKIMTSPNVSCLAIIFRITISLSVWIFSGPFIRNLWTPHYIANGLPESLPLFWIYLPSVIDESFRRYGSIIGVLTFFLAFFGPRRAIIWMYNILSLFKCCKSYV